MKKADQYPISRKALLLKELGSKVDVAKPSVSND